MIWFMTPDLPHASGGIQVIYSIVETLEANGIAACVWHGGADHGYTSFSSKASVVRGMHQELKPGDVLVMQEVGGPKWSFLARDNPVVMIVQGHTFLFDGLDFDTRLAGGYPGWPTARAALVVSDYAERTVHAMAGPDFPTHRIPPMIDPQLFAPREKERTIAMMPRRRRDDLVAVVQILERGRMLPEGWSFTQIDGLGRADVANRLGRAAVFLSGAQREGFGMPGAEAMSAGCAVVGFTGDGGAEYLRDDTAHVIHDNDFLGMAEAVAETARRYDAQDAELRRRTEAGRRRVHALYGPAAFEGAVGDAFSRLDAEGSPARFEKRQRIEHYQAHAPRSGVGWSAYRGARHLARRALDTITRRR